MDHNIIDLTRFFQERIELEDSYVGKAVTKTVNLGSIHVTSGQIVTCDPFVLGDMEPFSAKVAPSIYPVVASVIHFSDNNDERIGAAMIQFNEGSVVSGNWH